MNNVCTLSMSIIIIMSLGLLHTFNLRRSQNIHVGIGLEITNFVAEANTTMYCNQVW